jgi:hypothetical protein
MKVAERAKRLLYRPSVHLYGSLSGILAVGSTLATEYGAILLLDGEYTSSKQVGLQVLEK